MSEVMKCKDGSAASTDPSSKCFAVFYDHIDFLTLGTLVELAKSHVDKVYVIPNGDIRVGTLARSLGAEVIDKDGEGVRTADILGRDGGILVALYGDGTHDPGCIPRLIASVKNGCDIVHGVTKSENFHGEENILWHGQRTIPDGSGFIACSASYCSREEDFHRLINNARSSSGRHLEYVYLDGAPGASFFGRCRIGVVIPAYNEELLIEETIRSIPAYVEKFYVIDDCSTDGTPEAIKRAVDPRMMSVRHAKNRGVGAAIITGYKLALADGMDLVAVMAGDNQMDPVQLPGLLMPVIEGKADYTKGNRLIIKEYRKGMSKWRFFGNSLLTLLTKIASGYWHITDPQNGYTVISRKALQAIDLDTVYTYYGYCNDLLIKLNAYGMKTMDVAMPSRYGKERSHIRYSKYILKVSPMLFRGFLWRLKTRYIVLNFHPLILFYAAGIALVPSGILMGLYVIVGKLLGYPVSPNFPLLSALITLMGIQFLLFAMLFDMQAGDAGHGYSNPPIE